MDTKHRTHDFGLAEYDTHTEIADAREAENGAMQYTASVDSFTTGSLTIDIGDFDLSTYFESKFSTSMAEEALMNLDSHVSFFEIPIVFT